MACDIVFIITNDDDILEKDMNIKKGIFITNNHRLIQEFRWVGSRNLSNILKIYNDSFWVYHCEYILFMLKE